MEAGISQDNHLAVKLGNQELKMRVVDVGGGTILGTGQAPLVQDKTEFAADNPPMVPLPFLPNLGWAAPLTHGMDQLMPELSATPSTVGAAREHVKPSLQNAEIPATRALVATTTSIRRIGFLLFSK
jgi:hypothetical protein